ncbi:glycosyltransferase family 4 protein [Leptospira barantonii]|uniref:Glycosyl transferase family 1 n=1 Tax=Leptospira barantonii TaxID=2023184 RepID=A0ABX4NT35_9LEPT|nr:glycosyltransferase family 1 protein [Leptospira barantonii]PJZ58173.1 glycosyl transferase family 1 [Leptospira barantonii]
MKILYDHQIFTLQRFGGISRYFYEIMRGLKKNFAVDVKHSVLYSSNEYLQDRDLFPLEKEYSYQDWYPSIRFRGMYRVFRLLQWFGLIPYPKREMARLISKEIANEDFDIFHPTYYSPYFLKDLSNRKKPYVLTVHDMIHEKFPDYFSDAREVIENKKTAIENADSIVAISLNTKSDLLKYYNIPESKIKVIYHGTSFASDSLSEKTSESNKKDYILFTGNRSYYKNFSFFLKSVRAIFQEFPRLQLYCVGGGAFNREELQLIQEFGLLKRVEQFRFENDEELAAYYKNALLFVFPSRYEGFGIPLLEAFSCGCPVACSNTSSFPEVAGEAAFYFDPDQSESIYTTLRTALLEPEQRKEKIQKGKIQLSKFSWEKTTKETYELYESIIKN